MKQNVALWSEAIHKEAKALLDAGALVPLTAAEQRQLVESGKLIILPAKGVFTVKPPDDAVYVDGEGRPYLEDHRSSGSAKFDWLYADISNRSKLMRTPMLEVVKLIL